MSCTAPNLTQKVTSISNLSEASRHVGDSTMSSAMQLYLTRTANRSQRKLDKPLRQKIAQSLLSIAKNPEETGEKLSMPLEGLYSHHIKYKGKEFRIAYLIQPDTKAVIIVLIGPHENFYKKLRGLRHLID